MKNFRRSKKALSPVVASIILIAVTVAVSIAVAAWMGALTVGFMGSSSVTVSKMTFVAASPNTIALNLNNTGTKTVTITAVKVNNADGTIASTSLAPGTSAVNVGITGTAAAWTSGNPYKIDLYDSSGQVVGSYQATAP